MQETTITETSEKVKKLNLKKVRQTNSNSIWKK